MTNPKINFDMEVPALPSIQTVRHRHRQRRAKIFLGIGCLIIFVAYASIISVFRNGWVSMSEYREHDNSMGNRIELFEYQQDEIAQLLGGPDTTVRKQKVNDMAAIERSLNKLLRRRRLMSVETDSTVFETECKTKSTNATNDDGVFPQDFFTTKQLKRGAIVFHIIGLVYMFVALAIVCDEFFVPALDVITEWLAISDDVAGATFMAAGGSAPEFFTSVFGVFITQNNVGIGTIVGSAIFNILCVLAFCALFSKTVLNLTWWSLFRDVSFYVIGLFALGIFFHDEIIEWQEALGMFGIYIAYAIFMKYNANLETWVKNFLSTKSKNSAVEDERRHSVPQSCHTNGEDGTVDHRKSIPVLHAGAMFRAGLAHIALDDNTSVNEVASLPAASLIDVRRMAHSHPGSSVNVKDGKTVVIGPPKLAKTSSFPAYVGVSGSMNSKKRTAKVGVGIPVESCKDVGQTDKHEMPERSISTIFGSHERLRVSQSPGLGALSEVSDQSYAAPNNGFSSTASTRPADDSRASTPGVKGSNMYPTENETPNATDEEVEQPVDMSWPKAFKKQCIYIILLPIMFPLSVTLPDVKRETQRRFAAITFAGAVLWIAFYSYLMVWWANTIGITLGVPTEVMGLTILAAGTSIPDLITSVIVARKGLGDMAVSSSVGSNLFDICVGLPVPWLLFFAMQAIFGENGVGVISVQSKGLVCSVGLLFTMLVVLVLLIMVAGWRMNKLFGFAMILAYFGFCIIVVFLEVGVLTCPLRIVGGSC